jgi:hypothetical protein
MTNRNLVYFGPLGFCETDDFSCIVGAGDGAADLVEMIGFGLVGALAS